MYDKRTKSDIESCLDVQAINTTAVTTGPIIDTLNHEAIDLCFNAEIASGVATVAVYEGEESDMSDEALVDSDFLIGAAETDTSGTAVIHIGYVGNMRYIRVKVTGSDTPSMDIAGIAYKSLAKHQPTDIT